jgi:hypothetical protein
MYMTDIINKMRNELRMILKASVEDYPRKPRDKWLFDWPSQIILVVNQIFWCAEVEQAFKDMAQGDGEAMRKYNEFQVRRSSVRCASLRDRLSRRATSASTTHARAPSRPQSSCLALQARPTNALKCRQNAAPHRSSSSQS